VFGFRDLAVGIKDGVIGIVTQPMKGAKEEGGVGFLKGIGRGIAGAVVKPTVGVIDFVTQTTEGIKNTTTILDEKKKRIRYPRIFGPDQRMLVYDPICSEGQFILFTIENGSYQLENYIYHSYPNSKRCLLISDKTIFYLMNQDLLVSYKWSIKWRSPFSRTQFLSSSENQIELNTYNIDWKPTKKIIKIPDKEVNEKILDIIKPRLTTDLSKKEDDISEKQITAPTKKGFLVKCGAKIHSWNKRWMILQNGEMTYRKTEEGSILGTIIVNGSKIIQVDVDKRKYLFSIVTSNRTYHIQAQNEHDRLNWIAACIQHGGTYSD